MRYLFLIFFSLLISSYSLKSQTAKSKDVVELMSTERSDGKWTKFVPPKQTTYFILTGDILTIYSKTYGGLDIIPNEMIKKNGDEIVWKGTALKTQRVTVSAKHIENDRVLWVIDLEGSRSAYITRPID